VQAARLPTHFNIIINGSSKHWLMSGKPLIFLLNLDKNLYDIKKDNIFAMEKSTEKNN